MNDAERAVLRELRTVLLHLHKTLIDWQRREYELDRGALPVTALLQVLFTDEAFAWLRPMSGLIVEIDESLDARAGDKTPPPAPFLSLVAAARNLAAPDPASVYAGRYHAALQELPEAVLAHRDLVTILKLSAPPAEA